MSIASAEEQKTEPCVRYNIRAARIESGLKQYEFAEKVGVSQTYLSDLERGIYSPSPELFARICLFVGKPPSAYVYLDTAE